MIGDNIRRLRLSKSMTQASLAQQIGVGASTVNMWEKGKRKPNFDRLVQLSEYFGCTLDELIK